MKEKLYIYTLNNEKNALRLSAGWANPANPDIPLSGNYSCTVRGFKITDVRKIYKRKVWYETEQTIILKERDDELAYRHFIQIRKEKSRKICKELISNEKILDRLLENAESRVVEVEEGI